jgi:hypothetical protein
MSNPQTDDRGTYTDQPSTYTDQPSAYTDQPSAWTGWIAFAAIMLMIAGFLQMFYGFVALFNDEWVVWGREAALFVDLTGWAWAHIIWGALVVLVGFGLMRGNIVARIIGVIVASVSLIINFAFIPVYPFWAIVVIVIDALVIWAIIVHGRDMKTFR